MTKTNLTNQTTINNISAVFSQLTKELDFAGTPEACRTRLIELANTDAEYAFEDETETSTKWFETKPVTVEVINAASFKELKILAKACGLKSSGKGVTTDALREDLLNLISKEEPISNNSTPIGDSDITRDNAPAEETPTIPVDTARTTSVRYVKLPVLVQDKQSHTTRWEYRESRALRKCPMSDLQILDAITLILEGDSKYKSALFKFSKSQDVNVAGKDFIEPYKLKAIFEKVMGTRNTSIYITYFAQCRFIAKAEMSRGDKYMVGKRMHEALEQLRRVTANK